ncbi:hypothetical protein M2326_000409 [Flavobacterium sp. 7A]|nr:hypothetical protein [Flavobacterium sp. 7A]
MGMNLCGIVILKKYKSIWVLFNNLPYKRGSCVSLKLKLDFVVDEKSSFNK